MNKLFFSLIFVISFSFTSCKFISKDKKENTDESVVNNFTPDATVKNFVSYIGSQKLTDAYSLTNVEGYDYNDFSTDFSVYSATTAKNIYVYNENYSDATVYAEVLFKVNKDNYNTYQLLYYLKRNDNADWKIIGWEEYKSEEKNNKNSNNTTSSVSPKIGKYSYSNNSSSGEMEIGSVGSDYFSFFIYVGTDDGCTGELEEYEYAYLKNGKYVAEIDDCTMTFEFISNYVKIKESNCDYYRGVECSFAGTYYKE